MEERLSCGQGAWRGQGWASSNSRARRSTTSSAWRRPVICSPTGRRVGGQPGRHRAGRVPAQVGQHGERHAHGPGLHGPEARHQVLTGDGGRRRTLGGEGGDGSGGGEQHVDLVEQRRHIGLELEPAPQRLDQRGDRSVGAGPQAGGHERGQLVQSVGIGVAAGDVEPEADGVAAEPGAHGIGEGHVDFDERHAGLRRPPPRPRPGPGRPPPGRPPRSPGRWTSRCAGPHTSSCSMPPRRRTRRRAAGTCDRSREARR